MFKIISAQAFELLEARLVDQLMQPVADPFVEDQVLIPSAAIQRRLTFSIADRYGICSRVGFSFVATWLWKQVVELLDDFPERSPFDAHTLRWRIYKHFEDTQFLADHPRLRAYLDHADATMRFDLAQQVASLFDQYTTFRSDWLEAWVAGRLIAGSSEAPDLRADEIWQAALWRSLLQDMGGAMHNHSAHPSQHFLQALANLKDQGKVPENFKQTVHVFCVPSLPPLYLAWLRGIAAYRDVIVYVLDPCQEYWHDLVTARELARLQVSGKQDYQEVGHRLLSSWGRQTQAYVQLLLAQEGDLSPENLSDENPQQRVPSTLLGALQSSIHYLKDLTAGSLYGQATPDGSIQIHSCHSLTRELEVLQDCLLARFKQPHPPKPSDILVVVPDLDQAAPLIEGVFGHVPKECFIPYMISGVAPISVSPCAQGLITILKLARSRFTLGDVLEALRLPVIAASVGIPDDEIDTLAQWLKEADVRWGLGAAHRTELTLPATHRHSFEEGTDRLYLGYALPEDHRGLWQGQLAVESVEGRDAFFLDAFAQFLDRLQSLHDALQTALTPEQWWETLNKTLHLFLKTTAETVQELQALAQGIIESKQELFDAGALDNPIPVDVLMRAFEERLLGRAKGGVPTGSMTFAAMSSLRCVPHRFVCILGLNDQVFPSPHHPLEFDLIARIPRYGDRQRNQDERNLFLDLLLSARERLHLSYVGKDRRDNSAMPPSIVLAELIDALVPALSQPDAGLEQKESVQSALITQHALQAFSERYFERNDSDSLPLSFRQHFAKALQECTQSMALRAREENERSLWNASLEDPLGEGEGEDTHQKEQELDRLSFGLAAPFYDLMMQEEIEPEWRTVRISQLIQFIQNPVKFYLSQRLGIEMPWLGQEWPDSEDFEPGRNASKNLAERLVPLLLEGNTHSAALLELAQAGREFPDGLLGQESLAVATVHIEEFAQRARSRLAVMAVPDQERTLSFNLEHTNQPQTWIISGIIDSLHGSSQILYSFDDLNAKHAIGLWVRHLCLCAGADEGQRWTTEWLGAEESFELTALSPNDARHHLQDLLKLYVRGLNEPLQFFPKSAWAYINAEREDPESGLEMAKKVWLPSPHKPYAEGDNREYRLAFRGVSLSLNGEFEQLAQRILSPLLDHLQRVSFETESETVSSSAQ